jgi:hypothetical protein
MAKEKMDKNKKAGKKGVKGEGEMYKKSNKENVKGKGQQAEHPHHRLSAYEQYAAKYPEQQKMHSPPADLHHRASRTPSPCRSPKGGVMDADEFSRLKRKQQKDKLKQLQ